MLQELELAGDAAGHDAEIPAVDFDHRRPAHVRTDQPVGGYNLLPGDRAVHGQLQALRGGTVPIIIRELAKYQSMASAALRALANDKRLQILQWLKSPRAHFPPQVEGDLVKDGVCSVFIAEKLGVSQPTASEHLKLLTQAGLVTPKRIKQWTFYRRNEKRIREVKREISSV